MVLSEIDSLALRFRSAINIADRSDWESNFDNFPRGACGVTSEMFAAYLIREHGLNSFHVSAERPADPNKESHAWLEIGDAIIDLTPDQFRDFPHAAPYVSTDRSWHNGWSILSRHPSIELFKHNETSMLMTWGRAYAAVLKAL